jgi:hypothetical protein
LRRAPGILPGRIEIRRFRLADLLQTQDAEHTHAARREPFPESYMMQYMLIETFHENCLEKAYTRFHQQGRMLPDGVRYIDSWLTRDGTRCFQMMEADRFELLQAWMKNWDDLVAFEIFEIGDKPAAEGGA